MVLLSPSFELALLHTVVAYDVQRKQAAGHTVLSAADAEKEIGVAKIQSGTKRKEKRKR